MTPESKRASRKQARQRQLAQENRRRQLAIIIPIVIGVVALSVFAYYRLRPVEGTIEHGVQDRGHDVGAEYISSGLPPVGGVHDPRWQNCGIYSEPVDIGPAVHSMEHGAVWITYGPELPVDNLTLLREMVRGESYLLLSPFPDQKGDVVATAWGVQLEPDSASDERLQQFIDRYRGAGPEPGAPCTEGLGQPLP